MNKPLMIKTIEKVLKARNISPDLVDLEAEVDSKLTLSENIENILTKLNIEINQTIDIDGLKAEFNKLQLESYAENVKNTIHEDLSDLEDYNKPEKLEKLKGLVELVCKNDNQNLFVIGSAGSGKTYTTLNTISSCLKKDDYVYLNGFITPLELYCLIKKNNDKRVIVIDDTAGILTDLKALSLLKSALGMIGQNRIMSYYSSFKKFEEEGIPSSFIVKPNLIIITNSFANNSDIKAVLSRCFFIEVSLTLKEKARMFLEKAKKDTCFNACLDEKGRVEVAKKLVELISEAVETDFRLLEHGYYLKKEFGANWADYLKGNIQVNDDFVAFLEAEKDSAIVDQQVKKFNELSGLSRRSFFRVKKEIMKRRGF